MDMDILPAQLPAAPVMDWDVEESRREAKFLPALDGLLAGESLEVAAKRAHVSRNGLLRMMARSPRLVAQMRTMRTILRELAYLKAITILEKRLEKDESISNRDMTDILRAIKPAGENIAQNVLVVLDI